MNTVTTSDWLSLASARFPKTAAAGRIEGNGPFVVGVACGGASRIFLYETQAEQMRKIQTLDKRGCNNSCVDLHHLFVLHKE